MRVPRVSRLSSAAPAGADARHASYASRFTSELQQDVAFGNRRTATGVPLYTAASLLAASCCAVAIVAPTAAALAYGLDKADGKVTLIIQKLVEALNVPAESVQKTVAGALVPLLSESMIGDAATALITSHHMKHQPQPEEGPWL